MGPVGTGAGSAESEAGGGWRWRRPVPVACDGPERSERAEQQQLGLRGLRTGLGRTGRARQPRAGAGAVTSCFACRGRSNKHRSHKHRSQSLSPLLVPGAGQQRPGGQRPPAAVWTLSSLSLPMAGGLQLNDL